VQLRQVPADTASALDEYVPASHSTQLSADCMPMPVSYEPPGQSLQRVAASAVENMPAPHMAQALELPILTPVLKVPAMQFTQADAPVCAAYVPTLQLAHKVAPVSEAYAPFAQLLHAETGRHTPDTLTKPGLHVVGHEFGAFRVPGPVKTASAGSTHDERRPHPATQFQLDTPFSPSNDPLRKMQAPDAYDHAHDPAVPYHAPPKQRWCWSLAADPTPRVS
jgi:hypothetical protein